MNEVGIRCEAVEEINTVQVPDEAVLIEVVVLREKLVEELPTTMVGVTTAVGPRNK